VSGSTTQVFREEIKEPIYCAPMASGMAASLMPQTVEFTTAGNGLYLSVGPLDGKIFAPGDKVKIIVQRIGKRAAHASSPASVQTADKQGGQP
jgi:hypothetical protein